MFLQGARGHFKVSLSSSASSEHSGQSDKIERFKVHVVNLV